LIRSRPTTPHQNTILRHKLKSSGHIYYCRIRNHWGKLIHWRPTNPNHNRVLRQKLKSSWHKE
jgi:hypothetical protein